MSCNHLGAAVGLAAAGALLGGTLGADTRASRQDAAELRRKITTITRYAAARATAPRRTTITERELNAYLAYDAKPELPAGVVDPQVTMLGTGRLSGRAVVDLDAVRREKNPTSLLDPVSYLTGRLPLTVTGVLATSTGVGRFTLESATIGGVPVPKALLQQIVSHYSRAPERPNGVSLDDPFPLPARIREIQVERGRAVIVQ